MSDIQRHRDDIDELSNIRRELSSKKRFGEYVKRKRKEKRMTQKGLAEILGVSSTWVWYVENFVGDLPNRSMTYLISKALGGDEDVMLALAGRIRFDIAGIIEKHPKEITDFLRAAKNLSKKDWEELTKQVLNRID